MSTFCAQSDYEYVSKSGLIIESQDGDFTLTQVNAYNDVEKMPQCDVVVVARSYDTKPFISQKLDHPGQRQQHKHNPHDREGTRFQTSVVILSKY